MWGHAQKMKEHSQVLMNFIDIFLFNDIISTTQEVDAERSPESLSSRPARLDNTIRCHLKKLTIFSDLWLCRHLVNLHAACTFL